MTNDIKFCIFAVLKTSLLLVCIAKRCMISINAFVTASKNKKLIMQEALEG
jgi:hypothetical protein